MRLLRCLRRGLPDQRTSREELIAQSRLETSTTHHLRDLLWRRLFLPGPNSATGKSCAWFRTEQVAPTAVTACVKGRFAYGYAFHEDRILKP